jgi:hypothetical protein
MTAGNILIYLALIGYILYRRIQGQPVKEGRRLFVLPVLLIILGFGDVSGGTMKPVEVALTVIAGAICLALGLLRGQADKLSERDGAPFVQWGRTSVMLFVGTLAVKLVLDVIGIAAGSSGSAVGKSLPLTFGLTLLGEAVVLWTRTGGAALSVGPARSAATRATVTQPRQRQAVAAMSEPEATVSAVTPARGVGDALLSHHEAHRARHAERHNRRHGRG